MVTTAVNSPCSERIFPAIASTGICSPVLGSMSPISPTRRWSALTSMPAMKEEKCASLACTHRSSGALARAGVVNSRSAGAFMSEVPPLASVTTIGSATESMMRFNRSLSACA